MKILVPLDRSDVSETAVPKAAEIAKGLGDQLLLVTVINEEIRKGLEDFAEVEHEDPVDILEADLHGVAARTPVDSITELLPGDDPARAIIDRAHRDDVRMVVIATHGRTGLTRWRMGSVAERVVRNATAPVMVVPAPWRQKEEGWPTEGSAAS